MATTRSDLVVSLSADVDLTAVSIDASLLLSLLAGADPNAIKINGFDDVEIFDIDSDGNLTFADGIALDSLEWEDGILKVEVKEGAYKEVLKIRFALDGEETMSLSSNEVPSCARFPLIKVTS